MSSSTRSVRELLETLGGRWPADGDETGAGAVADRLDALLQAQPEAVQARVIALLEDPASEALARTAIYALQVAEAAGLQAAGWLAEDRLHLVDAQGRSLALALVGIDLPTPPTGDPASVVQLRQALDEAFGERRYVLWLRKPLPAAIDAPAIGRAVTLWLAAIERGEWHGTHAIYEDAQVELELVLTGTRPSPEHSAQVLRLEPVNALERLSEVDRVLVDQATRHDEEHAEIPLVFAVGATSSWRLPRGFPEQLLYGTADWARSTSDPPSYEAAFHASGRALFCDPLAANISAVWWFEPAGEDPLGFRCWSHENPWARGAWSPQPPPGPRFTRVGGDRGSAGRAVDVMRWTGRWGTR